MMRLHRGPAGPPRVLVVDDDDGVRWMLSHLLPRLRPDCLVETAADGLAALARIAAFQPNVIITDLHMPRLDGAGLCRWIKSNGFAHTKVLVLTGSPRSELLASALEAGADAWLAKPPKGMELLALVEQLLAGATPSRETCPQNPLAAGVAHETAP